MKDFKFEILTIGNTKYKFLTGSEEFISYGYEEIVSNSHLKNKSKINVKIRYHLNY